MNLSMSKRRKPNHTQKVRKRQFAQTQLAPQPEAVAAYMEVFEWAAENVDAAADLACMHETDWVGPMTGIAYSDHFKFPEEQVVQMAWNLRAWHILNGMMFCWDWPKPIAAMTEQEIIEQVRAEGASGKITLADTEE